MHPASGQWWRYVRSADSAFICPFRKISVARDRSEGPNYPPAQVGLQSPTCQLGMVLSATQSLEWDSLLRECIGCSYSVLIDFGAAIVSENDWNVDCVAKYKLKSIYPQNARKPWEIPTSQGYKNVVLLYPLIHGQASPNNMASYLLGQAYKTPPSMDNYRYYTMAGGR